MSHGLRKLAVLATCLIAVGCADAEGSRTERPSSKPPRGEAAPNAFVALADLPVSNCRGWAQSEPRAGVRVLRPDGPAEPSGIGSIPGSICEVRDRPDTYRVAFVPFVTFCGNVPVLTSRAGT